MCASAREEAFFAKSRVKIFLGRRGREGEGGRVRGVVVFLTTCRVVSCGKRRDNGGRE